MELKPLVLLHALTPAAIHNCIHPCTRRPPTQLMLDCTLTISSSAMMVPVLLRAEARIAAQADKRLPHACIKKLCEECGAQLLH